ncbi:MAG: M56 family metallopeptidase [Streptosporangiaceae bacterium]
MIAALALLGYAALLLTAGAAVLARARWTDRAPRLGVAAWLALTGSAVGSVVLGGAALVVPTVRVSTGLSGLLAACVMALRAGYAHPGGAATAGAGALLGTAVIARVCWCAAVTLARSSLAQRRHRRVLAMTGRPDSRLGAVLVDHQEAAAWCLPGAGRQVVLTTAAVEALDEAQLTAVLAHERAHQRGRHHLLVALAWTLAVAFPRVRAFRQGQEEVARLVELLADDAAAAASPRLTVAGALLALAAPAPAAPATLAAGGSATGARVRRLIAAPAPVSRARSAAGMLTVAALAAFPLVLLAGPALAVIGRDYCPDTAVARVVGHCAAAHGCGSAGGAQ